MKYLLSVGCLFLTVVISMAQSTINAPHNDLNHYFHQRMEIRTGDFGGIHSTLRPLMRRDIRRYQDSVVAADYWQQNKRRMNDYNYVHIDYNDDDSSIHSKKPFMKFLYPKGNKSFLKHFYKTPAHFLEVRTKHFYANVNPILHFKFAYERVDGQNRILFLNRRGAAIRGKIADRVYFYTDLIETQAAFPTYVNNRIDRDNAVPGASLFKQYNSSLTTATNDGVDYLIGSGYISVDLVKEHIGVQLGHGQHFIGDGHRSLFLSDYSPNYFYLKINTRVWKIHYQNIFAQLTQNYTTFQRAFDRAFDRKYLAAHHLSINILKNLNVGLFEGVIFSRGGAFDLQYLNPIIFYRTVEQAAGSPDNVVIGFNWKWNFLKHLSFYGQGVLDELAIGSLVQEGYGWWGNKFALQAGLKYIDAFGADHLDMQVEFNMARPFTYSFRDSTANWTHYNQPLAHPLGANFYEVIGIVNYQPVPNLYMRLQLNYAIYGQDTLGSNWGGNVHKSYLTRQQENGNQIGQGVRTNLLMVQFMATYQLRHNLFADLHFTYRSDIADLPAFSSNTLMIGVGLRWNIFEKMHDW